MAFSEGWFRLICMADLILLRHGRSEWNELNLFTGWHDVDLTAEGVAEAQAAIGALPPAIIGNFHQPAQMHRVAHLVPARLIGAAP